MNRLGVLFLRNRRARAKRAFSRLFDFPQEMFGGTSNVTLTSDCEALICGCRRVREYERCVIRLALCDVELTVRGEDLSMKTFFGNQILVCGKIRGLELG